MLANVKNWLGYLAGSLFDSLMPIWIPVVACEGD